MVKQLLPILAIPLMVLPIMACGGCSTTRGSVGRVEDLPFPRPSEKLESPNLAWKHQLEGKLTDLSVSSSSGNVLVSEVLESIADNRTQLSLFDKHGKRVWRTLLPSPVRSQAISSLGDWIMVSTYQEELIRLDPKNGKVLWRVPDTGMCRPIVLEKTSRVLCHHDDDASPGLVFQVFDSQGKKILDQKAPQDSLLLEVSRDEERILIGFIKGRVWMLDSDFKKLWEKQLPGEIVDAAASSPSATGTFIEAAALLNSAASGQVLVTLADNGKSTQEVKQHIPLQQLDLSENGKWISVYGNGPRGQLVAQYDAEPVLQQKWSYHYPRYADYNLRMDVLSSWTMLGFENIADRTRYSHVVALDRIGTMRWHLPLLTDDGAYLYSRGFSRDPGLLVVGTDDGVISAYLLKVP